MFSEPLPINSTCRNKMILVLVLSLALAVRYLVVHHLSKISSREPDTLLRVRTVLKILAADPMLAKQVYTKDRSGIVPGY